jgi:hypothetical protein
MPLLGPFPGSVSSHRIVPPYFLLYLCTPYGGVRLGTCRSVLKTPLSLPHSTQIIDDLQISVLCDSFLIPLLVQIEVDIDYR